MNGPQGWPLCDADVRHFVEKLLDRLKVVLGNKLTGVYLHGSLAMGSYYRPKSDIDLIVVVEKTLPADLAETAGVEIAHSAIDRPTVGNIELSVITADTAFRIPVPTPYEVHYSSSWHDRILNLEVDYSKERSDPDLLSHLTYVTQRGICLYGKLIPEAFGEVAWRHFMASVMDDLEWILEDEHILETPFYSVLNICRVLQLWNENNRLVHSKDEGGEWGLQHLSGEHHPLIRQALDAYRSSEEVSEEHRKTAGMEWDRNQLLAFRDFALLELGDVHKKNG